MVVLVVVGGVGGCGRCRGRGRCWGEGHVQPTNQSILAWCLFFSFFFFYGGAMQTKPLLRLYRAQFRGAGRHTLLARQR